MFVYVGSFTEDDRNGRGEGISVYRWHPESGSLARLQVLDGPRNPSFLVFHPHLPRVYAVNSASVSGVSVCERDSTDGTLSVVQQIASEGANPVHLDVHPSGSHLAVAVYGSSRVALYPIGADGRLASPSQVLTHAGPTGPIKERQDSAHPYQARFDPSGRTLLVNDFGLDRTYVYRFDGSALTPGETPYVSSAPGAGPRHLDFHPNAQFVYVINELNSSLAAFRFDAQNGSLEPVQVVSTLPEGFTASIAAEVVVHPNGRFVYASNRGHNSVTCFACDAATGRLELVGYTSTQGEVPRTFKLDPTAQFLFAANQEGDTIVIFGVDGETGTLRPTGTIIGAQSPTCISFG